MWEYAALAGLQVAVGLQQSEMMRMSADTARQIAELNAKWAEIDAWETEKFGDTQAAALQKEIDQVLGAQKVAMAAQDIDINFGTAAQIRKESETNAFLNLVDVKNAAHAKALGLKREARMMRMGANVQQSQAEINARGAVMGGLLSAAGTGITGYARYRSANAPKKSDETEG